MRVPVLISLPSKSISTHKQTLAMALPNLNLNGVLSKSPYSSPNSLSNKANNHDHETEGPASIGGREDPVLGTIYMITQGQKFQRLRLPETKDVATRSYLKYKEDVQLLKNMGVDVYRFSISWSRIFPNGYGVINQEGIHFYNNFVDELITNGIEPFVTLFHCDLRLVLQNEYNGFLDRKIVFLEPLVYGVYPFVMKAIVDDRLPKFTYEEKQMVQGSYDFIGINYYTSRYAK